MARLTVVQTNEDYRDGVPPIPTNTTEILFAAPAASTAIFGSNQFGGNPISDTVAITGDGFSNTIIVDLSQSGIFSAAGWSFNNWSTNDSVVINGTAGIDTITGSSQNDVINGFSFNDTISAGDGDDVLSFATSFSTRGSWTGGNGFDSIAVAAPIILDISRTTISGIEQIAFSNGGTVQAAPGQITAGAIATINGSAGADAIEILPNLNVDLSGVIFTNWTNGIDTITIDVSHAMGAAATMIGSSQNDFFNADFNDNGDTLQGGAGDDTFNLGFSVHTNQTISGGTGTDTVIFNSGSLESETFSSIERIQFTQSGGINSDRTTVSSDQFGAGLSTHLIVAGGTDPNFVYTLAVNMTAPGTFDASGFTVQNATVALVGTSVNDTITGTSFADVINGNGGNDTITGGAGNDTIDGGAGFDIVRLNGTLSAYTVTHLSDGGVQVSGPDGVDTIHNAEELVFDDTNMTTVFAAQSFVLGGYGVSNSAGGWTSQDQFPRMAADVNGDGRADIVGFGINGVLVALGNASGGFNSPVLGINAFGASAAAGGWSSNDTYHRTLGDVNGDGHADIIGFGSNATYVSLANSDGTFQSAILNGGGGGGSDNFIHHEVADVNGDGKADIVTFGTDGVYVALATSGGLVAPAVRTFNGFGTSDAAGGWSNDNLYHRELADVNGDGRADIVGFGSNGVYIALATGGGSFAQPTLALNAFGASDASGGWSQNAFPRHVADVNGDGMADIVGFGGSGVYVAFATGNGTFSSPEPDLNWFGKSAGGWVTNNLYPRGLADLNHDGAADIVGFGHDGVYTSLGHQFDLV
jgi:Ca2+-binding RTX toxin-like protein